MRADNITADAIIGTDGGSVRVGKLVGRTLEVNIDGWRFRRRRLIRRRPPRRHPAGGAVRVDKQTQVSDTGVVRSAGGNVTVGGVAGGDGEEGAIAVDTAGGNTARS